MMATIIAAPLGIFGLIHLFGIENPGLITALAITELVAAKLAS